MKFIEISKQIVNFVSFGFYAEQNILETPLDTIDI